MNGSIKVDSNEKGGTTFKFTIWTRASLHTLRSDTNVEMAGLEGKKVLVVSNNLTVCNSLKSQLRQWKLSSTLATSGKQALEILKQNPAFDLVLTETFMTEMGGLQLAQTIKQLYPDLPVILINKSGDESFKQHAELFTAVIKIKLLRRHHILSKPVFSSLRLKSNNILPEEQNYKQKLSTAFSKEYPLNILVAEDDKLNQKFALKILNKLGYEPHIANNGQEVLELVSQRNYDVILMDVQMPVMNGLEATKMIEFALRNNLILLL